MPEPLLARRPRGERLYSLPVVGYALRIAAGVVNLPHVLGNLERHYAVSGSDRTRLETQLGALRHELAKSVADRDGGDELRAELRALRAELTAVRETTLAETQRLKGELERVRAVAVRLACAAPPPGSPAAALADDSLAPVEAPPKAGERRRRNASAHAVNREVTDAGRPAPEEVGDLGAETALALAALPSGAPVLDFSGAGLAGYERALHLFGLKPRTPAAEELEGEAVAEGSCGAVWVDPSASLTLDGFEEALAVLGGRLPREAVAVVRGGRARFDPGLAQVVAGHRGFRLERMMSAPEGAALVLLRA